MTILQKSTSDRIVDGVCGGVAEYFGWNSTVVRIVWAASVLFGGFGLFLYVAAAILMPRSVNTTPQTPGSMRVGLVVGVTLTLAGLFLLLDEFHLFSMFRIWRYLDTGIVLPCLLIGIGIVIIVQPKVLGRLEEAFRALIWPDIRRHSGGKKLMGVCSGIALHMRTDPTLVRLLWVALTLTIFPLGFFGYFVLGLLLADEMGVRIIGKNAEKKQPHTES